MTTPGILPRVLVLYADSASTVSYYDDWQDAFTTTPGWKATALDLFPASGRRRATELVRECDLCVVLHSLTSDDVGLACLKPVSGALQRRRGKLLVMMGNEVNLPGCSTPAKIAFARTTGADYIGTMLPIEAGRLQYAGCATARVVELPHALNPAAFSPETTHSQRPLDLGVRSDKYPVFVGDNDRNELFAKFANHPFSPPLALDIKVGERLNRAAWANFLNRCKGTLATEAGTFFLEPDDHTVREILAYLRTRSGSKVVLPSHPLIWRWGRALPAPLKRLARALLQRGPVGYETMAANELEWEEIHSRFFKERPRPPVHTKHMTSRHFDAIGTKTCQIMFPGRFNDILVADRHYLALARDFSNLDEVIAKFRDDSFRQRMVDETHEFIRTEHTYEQRMTRVRELL